MSHPQEDDHFYVIKSNEPSSRFTFGGSSRKIAWFLVPTIGVYLAYLVRDEVLTCGVGAGTAFLANKACKTAHLKQNFSFVAKAVTGIAACASTYFVTTNGLPEGTVVLDLWRNGFPSLIGPTVAAAFCSSYLIRRDKSSEVQPSKNLKKALKVAALLCVFSSVWQAIQSSGKMPNELFRASPCDMPPRTITTLADVDTAKVKQPVIMNSVIIIKGFTPQRRGNIYQWEHPYKIDPKETIGIVRYDKDGSLYVSVKRGSDYIGGKMDCYALEYVPRAKNVDGLRF